MNNFKQAPFSLGAEQRPSQRKLSFLDLWYRFTAPPEPSSPTATALERGVARRGRIGSTILLLVLFLGICAIPAITTITGFSRELMIHVSSLVLNIVALYFNRRSKIVIAGVLTVLGVTIGFFGGLTSQPISFPTVIVFSLLVIPELVAASLLPSILVLADAFLNSLFILATLFFPHFVPKTPEVSAMLLKYGFSITFVFVGLQFGVAVVLNIWITSENRAILRATHHEAVAKVEHRVALNNQHSVLRTHELEEFLEDIRTALSDASNHKLTHISRIPRQYNIGIERDIVITLNTFFSRYHRLWQIEQEYVWTKRAITTLEDALYQWQSDQTLVLPQRSGLPTDSLQIVLSELLQREKHTVSHTGARFPL